MFTPRHRDPLSLLASGDDFLLLANLGNLPNPRNRRRPERPAPPQMAPRLDPDGEPGHTPVNE
jgi:hypothetical protein